MNKLLVIFLTLFISCGSTAQISEYINNVSIEDFEVYDRMHSENRTWMFSDSTLVITNLDSLFQIKKNISDVNQIRSVFIKFRGEKFKLPKFILSSKNLKFLHITNFSGNNTEHNPLSLKFPFCSMGSTELLICNIGNVDLSDKKVRRFLEKNKHLIGLTGRIDLNVDTLNLIEVIPETILQLNLNYIPPSIHHIDINADFLEYLSIGSKHFITIDSDLNKLTRMIHLGANLDIRKEENIEFIKSLSNLEALELFFSNKIKYDIKYFSFPKLNSLTIHNYGMSSLDFIFFKKIMPNTEINVYR